MPTKISTIYDAVKTRLATLFPNKRQLNDPDLIENNDGYVLEDGYGVSFGLGTNTRRQLGCHYSIRRELNIVLTKDFPGGHKNQTIYDDTVKLIFEDLHTVVKDFERNNVLSSDIPVRGFVSDTGIERVLNDNRRFLMIRGVFTIEYFEDLN